MCYYQQSPPELRDAGHILLYLHAVQPGLGPDSLEPASNLGLLAHPLEQPMLAIDR
jgi:hypothetical protein